MGEWSAGWAELTFRDAMSTPKKRKKKRKSKAKRQVVIATETAVAEEKK